VLTPLAVDQGRPFPHISNLDLNIGASLSNGDGVERFARIKVPGTLPHLLAVPRTPANWLRLDGAAIIANLRMLFPEIEILKRCLHVTAMRSWQFRN